MAGTETPSADMACMREEVRRALLHIVVLTQCTVE